MSNLQARVLYDFEGQASTELTINAGEVLTVVRQDVGEGWWEGLNSRGQSGLFPAGYVELISGINVAQPQQADFANFDAADADWGDDDWDDDDSQASTNAGDTYQHNNQHHFNVAPQTTLPMPPGKQPAVVRKNINRFSSFVKSGGEDYILGMKTLQVPEESYIIIIEEDGLYKWKPCDRPYTIVIDKPKKESKMKGLKSYIAYQLTPSFNSIQVSRRYKHFDWLHERLQDKFCTIPIPSLPDKQISGRYQEEFIEHRKNQLQSWVNRISRHPVLSQCDVWMHFIACTDDKRWKQGKRRAEKDDLVGASLFLAIRPPSGGNLSGVERQMEHFTRFISKMDDAVRHLFQTSMDQSKKYSSAYRREFSKIANAFEHVANSFEFSELQNNANTKLNQALKNTSNTYEAIGKLYEEQPKNDFNPVSDVMHEYKGILTAWPDILQVHKGALNKKKEHQKLFDEGKIDNNSVASITQRTDVVTYATLAEINHFETERINDFKFMMQKFLGSQIQFYQSIVDKLQDALSEFDQV